ncbi:hypothetical protein BKA69DRAFT_1027180, partial [Paraphysoderma sedebokerense]
IDYSVFFDEDVKHIEGLTIFRIEQLRPIPLHEAEYGRFCIADCYIVLYTEFDDHDVPNYFIYQWLGKEATLDKRACSAIHAVNLRNFLRANERVQREEFGDESDEFKEIFEGRIQYDDESFATAPGLVNIGEKQYPLRLYKYTGKKRVPLQLVEPSYRSLDSNFVYLLDNGLEIFTWNGKSAHPRLKSQCRLVADAINKNQRNGKVTIVTLDEGDEEEKFWQLIGERESHELGTWRWRICV